MNVGCCERKSLISLQSINLSLMIKKCYLMKKCTKFLGMMLLGISATMNAQSVIDFDTIDMPAKGYINGSDKSLTDTASVFSSGGMDFQNNFSFQDYFGTGPSGSWKGFAYSKSRNDSTAGLGNQYSAYFADTSLYTTAGTYAVGYYSAWTAEKCVITFDAETPADYLYLANTTYTYMAMKYGDDGTGFVADSFQTANNDTFKVIIEGYDAAGDSVGAVECYLAKFIDGDEYVIDSMMRVDISALGNIAELRFSIQSSDGDMPTYFVVDSVNGETLEDLTYIAGKAYWNGSENIHGDYANEFVIADAVFNNIYSLTDYGSGLTEAWKGFAFSNMRNDSTPGSNNQYSVYMADTAEYTQAGNYVVGFQGFFDTNTVIEFSEAIQTEEIKLANSTYAYLAMKYGDDGEGFVVDSFQAANNDTFKLVIEAIDHVTGDKVSKDFYLAKFTAGDEYVVDGWQSADLSGLPETSKLTFYLQSSDPNMPKYFCFDGLKYSKVNAVEENMTVETTVYPNPFSDYLTIRAGQEIEKIRIFDIMGRMVYASEIVQSNEPVLLNNLKKGIYFVNIQGTGFEVTRKVIKNR